MVQTGKKEVVKVVAGDPVSAFHEGVKVARELYEVEIDHAAEIVISGVSYPKSRDLYQATRSANAVIFGPKPVVRQGGVILIPAPCEDGCGHPGYCEIMRRAEDVDDIIAISREEGFAAGEQKALILARILKQCKNRRHGLHPSRGDAQRASPGVRSDPPGGAGSGIKKKSKSKGYPDTRWTVDPAHC